LASVVFRRLANGAREVHWTTAAWLQIGNQTSSKNALFVIRDSSDDRTCTQVTGYFTPFVRTKQLANFFENRFQFFKATAGPQPEAGQSGQLPHPKFSNTLWKGQLS